MYEKFIMRISGDTATEDTVDIFMWYPKKWCWDSGPMVCYCENLEQVSYEICSYCANHPLQTFKKPVSLIY